MANIREKNKVEINAKLYILFLLYGTYLNTLWCVLLRCIYSRSTNFSNRSFTSITVGIKCNASWSLTLTYNYTNVNLWCCLNSCITCISINVLRGKHVALDWGPVSDKVLLVLLMLFTQLLLFPASKDDYVGESCKQDAVAFILVLVLL